MKGIYLTYYTDPEGKGDLNSEVEANSREHAEQLILQRNLGEKLRFDTPAVIRDPRTDYRLRNLSKYLRDFLVYRGTFEGMDLIHRAIFTCYLAGRAQKDPGISERALSDGGVVHSTIHLIQTAVRKHLPVQEEVLKRDVREIRHRYIALEKLVPGLPGRHYREETNGVFSPEGFVPDADQAVEVSER